VHPILRKDHQYWVTVYSTPLGGGAYWATNNTQYRGFKADKDEPDSDWRVYNYQTTRQDAFVVYGTPVGLNIIPEPASVALFALGAISLAGIGVVPGARNADLLR
jgi:hypothetical protein